jgi:mannose-1-phosphate guanylyltransferase
MPTAFLLGAGLGTRLRPLTLHRPKPLIPLFHRPLATLALDHLIASGFDRFLINTHHCPAVWQETFGGDGRESSYRGCDLHFRHEEPLLETGGGLKNMEDLAGTGDLLLYNGDIFTDVSIEDLWKVHREQGNIATLGLRQSGGPRHIQWDPESGRVLDIRQNLGVKAPQDALFTGLYAVSPEIYSWIPPGEPISIIPILRELLRSGRQVGGVLLEEGLWLDLGERASYLQAHRMVAEKQFQLRYPVHGPWQETLAQSSSPPIVSGFAAIPADAAIGANVRLEDTVLWPGARLADGTHLRRCVVWSQEPVCGSHQDAAL